MKIAHLSDLHIGKNNTKTIRDTIIRATKQADIVVVTGDITENCTPNEYKTALNIMYNDDFEAPVLLVPGNHDKGALGNFHDDDCASRTKRALYRPAGAWDEDNWEIWENLFYTYMDEEKDTIFFCLDSADPKNTEFFARGKIRSEVRNELRLALDMYKDMKRVVILHHHPFIRSNFKNKGLVDGVYSWAMALEGGQNLMSMLKGRCECLLFGHKHSEQTWNNRFGIKLIHAAGSTVKDFEILEV